MGLFDNLAANVKAVAGEAVNKGGELAEKGKIKANIFGEEKKRDDAYKAIGKYVWEQTEQGYDFSTLIPAELLDAVKASVDRIKALQTDLDGMKADDAPVEPVGEPVTVSAVFCTACGQQVADGAKFCNNCGKEV